MPRRKKFVRNKKKNNKGKMVRVNFLHQKIVPRWPLSGFPDRFTAKLRYVQEFSLDPTFADVDVQSFRASGIFDPDFAIGGHQPLYSDELYVVYGQSLVVGAKMTVRWVPVTASNVVPAMIILYKDSLAGQLSSLSVQTVLEQTNRKSFQIGGLLNGDGFRNNKIGTIHYSPKKDLGFDNPNDEIGLRGSASAGPSQEYFMEVYSLSIAGNDPGKINFIAEIDYLVEFFDKNQVTSS